MTLDTKRAAGLLSRTMGKEEEQVEVIALRNRSRFGTRVGPGDKFKLFRADAAEWVRKGWAEYAGDEPAKAKPAEPPKRGPGRPPKTESGSGGGS